jgi:PAS domain S-box-containing protein
MKSDALTLATLRASRALSVATIVASLAMFAGHAFRLPWLDANVAAWPLPLACLVIALLACGSLAISVPSVSVRAIGQLCAILGGGLSLFSASQTWFGVWNGSDHWFEAQGRISGPGGVIFTLAAIALLSLPRTPRRNAPLFTFATGAGLSFVAASLVGLALGTDSLARLGLDRAPSVLVPVLAGIVFMSTLAQRTGAGWLSVLLGPSAAGSSARGVIAWTLVGPLLLAAMLLAGVRAGFYSLEFGYALFAALTCGGLTWIVVWNAARVEREQQRAERHRDALDVAASRLRLAQTASGVHLWEWVPHSREWRALDDRGRLDPAANEYLEAGLARCLRDGNAEFEYPHGEDRWRLATCWREPRPGHDVIVGVSLDVTERRLTHQRLRATEQRLRDSLQRLELALDGASVGMWDWDLDSGRITFTRQTHLITGIPEAGFTGRAEDFFRRLRPADVDHGVQFLREITEPGVVRESELRLQRPDGTEIWVQNRATSIVDDDGRMVGIVGTLRDVTQRRDFEAERDALLAAERAARAELAAAAQAKDEFLATISHELRTPLNAILGWTTLLQRPRVEAALIPEGLKVIERNARAQTQLLGDLLDANQLASGKLSMSFEPMDLNDAVRETIDSLRVSFAARKLRVDSRLCPDAIPVLGDSPRLQQIVGNLLSNALKFTPADGTITIVTRYDAGLATCEVRDTGEGIAPEFLPRIFEKFSQAEGGSARRVKGLGLGLAITRQLVEAHGGTISVESEGRGKGAAFVVTLPRLVPGEAAVQAVAGEMLHDRPLAGLRILAVDDEADSREYVRRLLVEQGAEVVSVASAGDALEALAGAARFDLLISDIGMPGATGYDLIDSLRQRSGLDARALPAIALTAFTRREDAKRALERGFQKHLGKPVEVGKLVGAIRELTRRVGDRGPAKPARVPPPQAPRGQARTH